jgi:Domain of unknown function (DUF4291)
MKLEIEPYLDRESKLPKTGRHILAQFDDESIVVYQAYRPAIGLFAANNNYFGGEFSFERMSWIKPNFLWMMYRSDWGTKPGQEITLAVRLKRIAFDRILSEAIHAKYVSNLYKTEKEWKNAVRNSSVRLQWDPDRTPTGTRLERRAIQLGLREEFLKNYAQDWIIDIEDISDFVSEPYQKVKQGDLKNLFTPKELIYSVNDTETAKKLQLAMKNELNI